MDKRNTLFLYLLIRSIVYDQTCIKGRQSIFISKVSSASWRSSSVHLRVSFFKGCFCPRHRQMRRMLGLRLSISSSQGFYKIVSSELEVDEDLKN